ncbi:hypothetical protein CCACVL1_19902 [Corchorus capsularis]|uniref:DUF4283 domain-containing protein n=1 Tax=Corchorus capsularis TaxID=210143 RepID=A0A1R3HE13_COCAP|nr:hypothetical protein CCACVL1_19902 [Corchorus capsularis]
MERIRGQRECSWSNSDSSSRHIDKEWRLRGRATVLGREGNNYLIELTEDIDRNYVVQESPWLLDGGMLVVEPWRPNTALRDVEVRHTNMWVQLWGMPLEYFQEEIAHGWEPDPNMQTVGAGNENFGQQTDQQHQQQQGGEQLQNLEGTNINLPPLPEILLNLPQVEYEENRVTIETFHQSEGSQQEEPQLLPEEVNHEISPPSLDITMGPTQRTGETLTEIQSQEAHINQGKGLAETMFEIWQEQQSKIDEMFNEMNKQGGRYLDDLLQRVYGSPYTQPADNTPRTLDVEKGVIAR